MLLTHKSERRGPVTKWINVLTVIDTVEKTFKSAFKINSPEAEIPAVVLSDGTIYTNQHMSYMKLIYIYRH